MNIIFYILLQLYPFGYANGDVTLPYLSSGEGSSSSITLTKSLYFYNEIIRIAYVSYIEKCIIQKLVNKYIVPYVCIDNKLIQAP